MAIRDEIRVYRMENKEIGGLPACTAHAQREALLQYANGRQKPVTDFTGVLTNGQREMRRQLQHVAFILLDAAHVGDGRTVDAHEAATRRPAQELLPPLITPNLL